MARRRALVDAGGKAAHLGHLVGDLLPHQMSAEPHLASLADEELARVREHEVMGVEPVARLDALVEPLGRVAPLVRDHASLARARRRPRHRRPPREGGLRLVGKGAEAHAGDVDRDVELQGDLRARADDRASCRTSRGSPRSRTGSGSPGRKVRSSQCGIGLNMREAAHPVPPELGLDVDVVDHLPGEDPAPPEEMLVLRLGLAAGPAGSSRGAVSLFAISLSPVSLAARCTGPAAGPDGRSEDQLLLRRLQVVVVPELLAGDDLV